MEKDKRDYFIDFVKGCAILMVILLHSIPGSVLEKTFSLFWLEQAVPLFILVQAYHIKNAYIAKGRSVTFFYSKGTLTKIFRRIVLPFLLLSCIQIVLYYWLGILDLPKVLRDGGIGPGSYYIYVYIEIALIAPCLYYVLRNRSTKTKFLVFIFLSELLELFCSWIHISNETYRLLFFRYFFLIYLGFSLDFKEMRLSSQKIFFACLSVVFILIDGYSNFNLEPFVYHTVWKGFHWLAYFYTAYIALNVLSVLYRKLFITFKNTICLMGRHSYQIFLSQMFVFGFDVFRIANIEFNPTLCLMLLPVKIALSIFPVLFFYYSQRKYLNKVV